jgi:hypothetical protein
VHISLANASNIAEKAVGVNAHTTAVRIGVVYGFLVYKALVLDSSNGCHDILVGKSSSHDSTELVVDIGYCVCVVM